MNFIEKRVHELYWNDNTNCARTTLICLSELFKIKLELQTLISAVGLHGAGGFRAQCGLVEGGLMFIGIYYNLQGKSEEEIIQLCYEFADSFQQKFGSLRCYELRPEGFTSNDPPHLCEALTCRAIDFAGNFIKDNT
ncbi:MAG: C_GCAxxG_C_C family protein [Clostridium sp.]|nr:C_GCAxxG_C_C family protein [Clostridium sp.]